MIRFLPGLIPTLVIDPSALPAPWVMPNGYSREHRDRLAQLLFSALLIGQREVWPIQLTWAERSLVQIRRENYPRHAAIWWRLPSSVRFPDVLRFHEENSSTLALFDADGKVEPEVLGWIGPLKLEVLRAVAGLLWGTGSGSGQSAGATGDEEKTRPSSGDPALSEALQSAASFYESPVDLLDFTNEILALRYESLPFDTCQAMAHGRVLGRRFREGGLDRVALEQLLNCTSSGEGLDHEGLVAAGFLRPISLDGGPTSAALLLNESQALRAFLLAIENADLEVGDLLPSRTATALSFAQPRALATLSQAAPRKPDGLIQADDEQRKLQKAGTERALDSFREDEQKTLQSNEAARRHVQQVQQQLETGPGRRAPRKRLEGLESMLSTASSILEREKNRGMWWSDPMEEAGRSARYVADAARRENPGEKLLRARALALIGDVAARAYRHREAEEALTEAHDLFRDLGNVEGSFGALQGLGEIYRRTCRLSDAQKAFEQALRTARTLPEPNLAEAKAFRGLGEVATDHANYNEALTYLNQALTKAQALAAIKTEVQTLVSIGDCDLHLGRLAEAEDVLRRALEKSVGIECEQEKNDALFSSSNLLSKLGQHARAESLLRTILQAVAKTGNTHLRANCMLALGDSLGARRQSDEAEATLITASQLHEEIEHKAGISTANWLLGRVDENKGESDAALSRFFRSLASYRTLGYAYSQAAVTINISFILLKQSQTLCAAVLAADAIDIVERTKGRFLLVETYRVIQQVFETMAQEHARDADTLLEAANSATFLGRIRSKEIHYPFSRVLDDIIRQARTRSSSKEPRPTVEEIARHEEIVWNALRNCRARAEAEGIDPYAPPRPDPADDVE